MWQGVSVATKPASNPLETARLKAWLRVDTSDDDTLIGEVLADAVAKIDGPNGIGYALMEQTWRKSMDDFPAVILLPGAPIKSVTSIKYLDTAGTEQTLPASNYRVDISQEPVRVTPAIGSSWPSAQDVTGAVWVDYLLGEDDAANVTPDLLGALRLLCAHRYEFREAIASGTLDELPLGVASVLDEHRRISVAA